MSSPLQLELTRHELFAVAPGTPAIGPAVRVEVTPKDRPAFFAIARLVMVYTNKNDRDYYRVFFRDETRPHDEIFSSGGHCIVAEKEPPSPEELLQRTIKGANSGSVNRFWQPPDLSYCLSLEAYGMGSIIAKPGQHGSFGDFYWGKWENDQKFREDKMNFCSWNTRDFHAFCRQLLDNPDSEVNFFLNWQKLSAEEKTAYATRCQIGDWDQLLHLFTRVLQLLPHYFGPHYSKSLHQITHYLGPSHSVEMQRSDWEFTHSMPTSYDHPAIFFARRWQEALFNIIRPSFWPNTPLCSHQWRRMNAGVKNHVECELATLHEFLEAQLQLRDFLRPHLSEAEIQVLLTP